MKDRSTAAPLRAVSTNVPNLGDASGNRNVESRIFTIHNFALDCGTVLPEAAIAYETYGRLDATGRNVVLLTHGFTSSHHGPGKAPRGVSEHEPGWWEALVGPGRAI